MTDINTWNRCVTATHPSPEVSAEYKILQDVPNVLNTAYSVAELSGIFLNTGDFNIRKKEFTDEQVWLDTYPSTVEGDSESWTITMEVIKEKKQYIHVDNDGIITYSGYSDRLNLVKQELVPIIADTDTETRDAAAAWVVANDVKDVAGDLRSVLRSELPEQLLLETFPEKWIVPFITSGLIRCDKEVTVR